MKNIFKTCILGIAAIFSVGCEKDEDKAILGEDATITTTLSSNTLLLEEANADDVALSVSWENSAFGVNLAPSYNVAFSYQDKTTNVSAETSPLELTTQELNTILTGLGFVAGTSTDVQITVVAVLSEFANVTSAVQTLTATTYEDVIDLTTSWGVVGSITEWGGSSDIPFWRIVGDDAHYVAYITVAADGEIKFRKDSDWAENYGDNGADGTLEAGGDNIEVEAGIYRVLWNINTNTYTIEKYTWGIIGSGANGWGDSDDIPLSYDGTTNTWIATGVTLNDGEIKIRHNNSWTTNYGIGSEEGILELNANNNIPVTAGTYDIRVNLVATPPTYSIQ